MARHPAAAAALAVAAAPALALALRRLRAPLVRLAGQLVQGLAVLRRPGRYLREVAVLQLGAWACRLAVAFSLLAAFGTGRPLSAARAGLDAARAR